MHKPTKTVACVVKEPPQHTQYCSVHIPKSDHGPQQGLYTEMDPLILSLTTILTLICVGSVNHIGIRLRLHFILTFCCCEWYFLAPHLHVSQLMEIRVARSEYVQDGLLSQALMSLTRTPCCNTLKIDALTRSHLQEMSPFINFHVSSVTSE